MTTLASAVLLASAMMSLWLAVYIRRRFVAPGSRPLAGLMLAVTWWAVTAVLWEVAVSVPVSTFWATLQFAGIAAVPPLWLVFVGEYNGAPWADDPRVRGTLGAAFVIILAMVATNPWHGWAWPEIEARAGSFPLILARRGLLGHGRVPLGPAAGRDGAAGPGHSALAARVPHPN